MALSWDTFAKSRTAYDMIPRSCFLHTLAEVCHREPFKDIVYY